MINVFSTLTFDERVSAVYEMDADVRNNIGDEDIILYWLELGVPDHIGELPYDDAEWFANDEDEFNYLCEIYERCKAMELGDE